jgi:predicted transposase YbfD/YdcC
MAASRPYIKPVSSQTVYNYYAVSADGSKRFILQSPEPLLLSDPKYPKAEKGETLYMAKCKLKETIWKIPGKFKVKCHRRPLSWASNKEEALEKIILEEAAEEAAEAEARAKRAELLENAIKTEGVADFAFDDNACPSLTKDDKVDSDGKILRIGKPIMISKLSELRGRFSLGSSFTFLIGLLEILRGLVPESDNNHRRIGNANCLFIMILATLTGSVDMDGIIMFGLAYADELKEIFGIDRVPTSPTPYQTAGEAANHLKIYKKASDYIWMHADWLIVNHCGGLPKDGPYVFSGDGKESVNSANSHTGEKSYDSMNLWSERTGCFWDYAQIANKSVEHIRLAAMIDENRDELAGNILVADAQSTVAENVVACLRNGILFSFAVKANQGGLFDDLKAVVEGNADGIASALRVYHALHPGNPALSYEDPEGFKPRESGVVVDGKTMETRSFGSVGLGSLPIPRIGFISSEGFRVEYKRTVDRPRSTVREYVNIYTEGAPILSGDGKWEGVTAIGMTISTTFAKGKKITVEPRYFINNLPSVQLLARATRREWGVEANHWNLDVIFKEDKNRTTIGNGIEGFQLVRKISDTMLKIFKAIRFEDRDSMNKAISYMTNDKMDRLAELSAAFMARSYKSSKAAGGKRLAA